MFDINRYLLPKENTLSVIQLNFQKNKYKFLFLKKKGLNFGVFTHNTSISYYMNYKFSNKLFYLSSYKMI